MGLKHLGAILLALLGLATASCHNSSSGGGGVVVLTTPQLGTITIDLTTGAVTIVQPDTLVLTGTAVYDGVAGTVTLSLGVGNTASRILFNVKAVVTSVNEGVATGSGTYQGNPYVYYGPEGLLTGTEAIRDIVITGVTGGIDPIVVDVEIVNHPMLFLPSRWDELLAVDSSGTGEETLISGEAVGFEGNPPPPAGPNDMMFFDGAVSSDGRFLYMGHRNQPGILLLDTTTLLPTVGLDLTGLGGIAFDGNGTVGFTDSVTLSPDGLVLYVLLNDGAHPLQEGTYPTPEVQLVQVLRSTLAPLSFLTVRSSAGTTLDHRGRGFTISADGTRGALALYEQGEVYLIDLVTMTIVDADPLTPGDQPFDVSGRSSRPRFVAISPDGATIAVLHGRTDGTLDLIDVAAGTIGSVAPPTLAVGTSSPGHLRYGPDGRLYYLRASFGVPGLSIYDPAAGTWIESLTDKSCLGVAFSADGGTYYVYDTTDAVVHAFDILTDLPVLNDADGLPTIPAAGAGSSHGAMITPF